MRSREEPDCGVSDFKGTRRPKVLWIPNETVEKIRKIVKKRMRNFGGHGWDHVERVYNLCVSLGKKEKADVRTLEVASLLHDIVRGGDNHASTSAKEAERILLRLGLPRDKISGVTNVIKAHSFSGGEIPLTLEAKILSDADKLDAMGAVGIYRVSAFSGEAQRSLGETINHFYEKLLKLRDMMYTKTAKRMADERHRFMLTYLKQLKRETKIK